MYGCKEHTWKYERGCAVCRECGLVNDDDLRLSEEFSYFEESKSKRFKLTSDIKRFLKLDRRIKYQIRKNYLLDGLLDVLAEIDISMIQKQMILNHVNKLNPKGWKDVFDYFILTIIKFEIPITNSALLRVLKGYKLGKKAFEDFKYKQRSYEWYIWKLLSKLNFLKATERTGIYKRVRKKYLFIMDKTIGLDPTALIGAICHHIIKITYGNRKKGNYISPKKRYAEVFNINRTIYKNYKEKGYLD